MIHVLDEIVLAPERLQPVLNALEASGYRAATEQRGLTLLHRWVSPPVARPGEPNTLWLLWRVEGSDNAFAYYVARSQQGAEVGAFWNQVAELAQSRRRHVLADTEAGLPAPVREVSDVA